MCIFALQKILVALITFTGVVIACMAVEISGILINLSGSFIVVLLKEKNYLVNFYVIAIMQVSFLYLTIAFKVGWSSFLTVDQNSQTLDF